MSLDRIESRDAHLRSERAGGMAWFERIFRIWGGRGSHSNSEVNLASASELTF